LVVFASVLPSVFAETNADRFKRGYPPLPPSRREAAKRQQPSSAPPKTASGFLEVRDSAGVHLIGFVENTPSRLPFFGVTGARSGALQAIFDPTAHTLKATNPVFSGPVFIGPNGIPPPDFLLTTVPDGPYANVWSFIAATNELTISLPKLAAFAFNSSQNVLEVVADKQPQSVRLYLVSS